MSGRQFFFHMAVWALVCLVATTPIGALLGFMLGFVWSFLAMLVTPGATAYLLTDRFGRMIGLAVGMGVGTSLVGAYASYYFDGSTGGCIVTLQSLLFVLALVFAPKHGLRASRRRQAGGARPPDALPDRAEPARPEAGFPLEGKR